MKKTYRHSRRPNKPRNSRVKKRYTLRRRMQKGGAFHYELDVSTDLNVVFVTYKTRPRVIYKIDLPSKTFSIFTGGPTDESYPLDKKYDMNLLKILNHAKINDYRFEDLLIDKGIDNIEYYPDDGKLVRHIQKPQKKALLQIEEYLPEPPLPAIIEEVDVLQAQPVAVSPRSPLKSPPKSPLKSPLKSPPKSPSHSKTVKNVSLSGATKERLRKAMQLASGITDDTIAEIRRGNIRVKPSSNADKGKKNISESMRLPNKDRPVFKP